MNEEENKDNEQNNANEQNNDIFNSDWINVANMDRATITKAWKFAEDVVKTIDYTDRKQPNKEKVRFDYFIGKVGEEGVCAAFAQMGIQVYSQDRNTLTLTLGPDYAIYSKKRKTFGHSIFMRYKDKYIEISVHTQAVSQTGKYGTGWTFQIQDPILNNPEAWVIFVECDDTRTKTYDCIVHQPYQMKELELEDAIGYYAGIKKFIRKENLPCFQKDRIKTIQPTLDDLWDL